jgi:hypothetical protein
MTKKYQALKTVDKAVAPLKTKKKIIIKRKSPPVLPKDLRKESAMVPKQEPAEEDDLTMEF